MAVIHTTDSELADLIRSGALTHAFAPTGALVVVVVPDHSEPDRTAVELLASRPCIVIATDRDGFDPPAWADAVIEPDIVSLDQVLSAIDRHPMAATALALLLRDGANRSLGAGLVAESVTYSLLQAGPEFAAWRAGTPPRDRTADTEPAVLLERNGDRLDLILNRAQVRNALNRAMRDGLLDGLALAEADPSISEVVVRGHGPTFCSGGDLDEFGTFDDPASAHMVRLTASIGRTIAELGPRVRFEVHGSCAGSGVELPAFSPHVIARPDFTAALPEVALGLIPGAGGTVSVVGRIGSQRTALLALSGARIDATTALAWGLIDEVSTDA